MDKKEQIILTTLELAAEHGLGSISMSQIAEKLGMRKPSLYNHFASKEAIIAAMYEYLREKSKQQLDIKNIDFGELVKDKSLEQVLMFSAANYGKMTEQKDMLIFYKIIYSQRSIAPAAAKIMKEETQRMLLSTKNLFYALQVHGKLHVKDIDAAANSFAMAIHSIMDYTLDCINCGEPPEKDMLREYIHWFCQEFGGNENEKNSH